MAIRPLLQPGVVEDDDDPLAVAVPRSGLTGRQTFLEDEERFAVIEQFVFLGRDENRRPLDGGPVLLDAHLDEVARHRPGVRFVPSKHGDLSAVQPPRLAILLELNRPERHEHALAAR